MSEEKSAILQRGISGNCPHCGEHSFMKNWFQIHANCPACQNEIESESGFTLATTSIAYVLSIIFVLIPICVLIVMKIISVLIGILAGIIGSLLLSILIYPMMLRAIVTSYYYFLSPKK